MIDHCAAFKSFLALLCGAALASSIPLQPAFAAPDEQVLQTCKQSAGPQVQACMQGKRGGGDNEANLAACRDSVKPLVRACVQREMQKTGTARAPGALNAPARKMPFEMAYRQCRMELMGIGRGTVANGPVLHDAMIDACARQKAGM
jgi:hypothetical protein